MEAYPNRKYQRPDLRSGQSDVESSFSGYLGRDTPIHSFISWFFCIYQKLFAYKEEKLIQTNSGKKVTLFANCIIFSYIICLFNLYLVRPESV